MTNPTSNPLKCALDFWPDLPKCQTTYPKYIDDPEPSVQPNASESSADCQSAVSPVANRQNFASHTDPITAQTANTASSRSLGEFAMCHLPSDIEPSAPESAPTDPTHHDISESVEFLKEVAQQQSCKTNVDIPEFPSQIPQPENCKTTSDLPGNSAPECPPLKSEIPSQEVLQNKLAPATQTDPAPQNPVSLPSSSLPSRSSRTFVEEIACPERLQNKPEPTTHIPSFS